MRSKVKIIFSKNEFVIYIDYSITAYGRYRHRVYRFKYVDVKSISYYQNRLFICGEYQVDKYKIRLLGKIPWNYVREKHMVSKLCLRVGLDKDTIKKIRYLQEQIEY